MNFENAQIVVISLVSIANIVLLVWQTRKRMPSELGKMRAEETESISEGVESNMEAAKISNELLLQRIRECKKDARDAWNYVAILKREMIAHNMEIPRYVPTESDPNIPTVKR